MGSHPPSVLITGASTGIGAAAAARLDQLGWRVFAGVRREEDGARLVAQASERLHPLRLDVTEPAEIAAAATAVGAAVGPRGLDGLVNNAGVAVGGPLEYLPAEELRRQLEVNVVGLHAVTRAFLPLVRRARGRVVHIGSISGRVASPLTGAYAASKHAVEALADVLRLELAPEGIHVSVIEPGQIATPIWAKGEARFADATAAIPPEGMARYGRRLAVLRWMVRRAARTAAPPDLVADALVHALAAPDPRPRYLVGRDAVVRYWLSRLLPTRVMDALVLRLLGRLEARVA